MNDRDKLQNSSETETGPDIHDRVAEAYYGLMGQQFMRETQSRIHWICRHIQGDSVVDVGCSQGIVPILLGREGLKVIGLDVSQKAIEEAKLYLANEPEHVQRNVSFINTDFLSWDFGDLKTDTVVMSEVLEHLTRPDFFLEVAARVLPGKGRLIVTVPFGINDFIDHKHTFYLLKPVQLVAKYFDVVGIEVLGKWLGIVADRRVETTSGAEAFHPTVAQMEKLEGAFYQTERVLRDDLLSTRKKLDEANQKYRGATEQVAALKQRVGQEETARRAADQGLQHLELTQTRLQEERTTLQLQIAQLIEQGQKQSGAAHEAEKKLIQLEGDLDAVRARLDEANQKYRVATEQVTALKQRVGQEETARRAADQGMQQATSLLELIQARLQEERTALQRQIMQLSEQSQAQSVAAHEGEKKLIRLETDLNAVRSQLEEVNKKYRGATEQVSALTQRVTQEETARQAAEHGLRLLEQSHVRLQEERTAIQQQLAQLGERGQVHSTAAHEAEKKVIRLEAELEAVRGRLEDANQKYRKSTEQVSALKETARQLAEQGQRQANGQLEKALGRLEEERAALQQQIAQLSEQRHAQSTAAHEAEKKQIRLESDLEGVRARLEEANQKYRGATDQVSALKQRVTQEETAHQTTEQTLRQLEQSHIDLQEERTGLQQQLTQLNEQGRAQSVAAYEVEKKLIRLEAELEAVRARLEEANQKYRGATEQVTVLKQRVEQEEAARQAAEQGLRQTTVQLEQANSKYRQVTAKEIPELKNKLEAQYSKAREGQHTLEQLRIELRKDRKALAEKAGQLEQVRQQKKTVEQQLVKTRATISFQFGHLLIHGFKSVNGFVRLPSALWALRKEAVQRRKKKGFKPALAITTFSPQVPSAQPQVISPQSQFLSQDPQSEGCVISADSALKCCPSQTVPSDSNGKLSIACIMDEFTFSSFQPEARLHQLTPANWRAELETANPDLLFIESAWRGKDELWGNKVGHTSAELQGIVEWCGAKKIPTVFWCKEDPIHFETFLNTAKLFNHVFTTDIDCIHRYKGALGHDRVYLLPFACQPAMNNPIETYQRKDAFCFAGAYYVRYPERTRDLGNFVMELPAFRPLEIYDRNYGKNDANYQFPEEYRPYIVGTLPFDQIDKAYKGYKYAINLNSIKQSQSMFARRVFELLGSNTITISNFSRGLRLLFGDLVITSDSGHEIVRRLNKVASNEEHSRKLRLAALRKVMQEHTYGQRLAYVISKISGKASHQAMPHIAVLAYALTQSELNVIRANYQRQTYANTSLYVVIDDGVLSGGSHDRRVHLVRAEHADNIVVDGLDNTAELIAGMVADDYYGPNYLHDIALATRYTQADMIGKAARYLWESGAFQLEQSDQAYQSVHGLPARAGVIRRHVIAKENVLEWVQSLSTRRLQDTHGLAIDEFNYCRHGAVVDPAVLREKVDDLEGLDTGVSINALLQRAERIAPEKNSRDVCPSLTGKQLAANFGKMPSAAIQLRVEQESWRVDSTLSDGKHEYLYATAEHSLNELGFADQLKIYLDVTPGLNIQLVVQFLDAQKQKISHVIKHANRNQEAPIPPGTDRIRFGLRFYAGGNAEIKRLVLGHRNWEPAEMIGQAEHLLLTNHYASYDDLYRNAYVHSRVRAYREQGVGVDVFRLRPHEAVSYHEFENVDVITGSQEVLHQMLSTGQYKTVLVHFLDPGMWDVLQHHIKKLKVVVWVHGAEIQPWHRREFNCQTEDERAVAKMQSEKRMAFWRELLKDVPAHLRLIFVSRYFAEEVMADLGFRIPEGHYTIIHNPINTDVFRYEQKSPEQRKKVLSIRPYASRIYANDLSVKAIQVLSTKSWFNHMEFRMIGDGPLFEETLAPLREYRNVYIEQRFLKQYEIAALHKEYGIFLCPSRMDSQGVSRDEAMSSGLVPVTNAVAAIPDFVDADCGMLAKGEDALGLAKGIADLYENPGRFLELSNNAAKRVRQQSGPEQTIAAELRMLVPDQSLNRRFA
ncbi:methyltransferase domain-containing protein [Nitrospira sp. Nam74]